MNSANAEKTQDLEKSLALSPNTPGCPNDIRLLKESEEKDWKAVKMQRTRHLLFALLVLTVLTFGVVCSSSNNNHHRDASPALPPYPVSTVEVEDASVTGFRELLNTVEPSSLHEILHKHLKDKYQHGVYQEDKKAMEVVHQENAQVAESLVELAKREGAGNTNTSSVVTVAPSSTLPVKVSLESTSTVPPSSTDVKTSAPTTAHTTQASTSVQSTETSPSQSSTSQGVSTSTISTRAVSSTTDVVSASTTSAVAKTTTKDGSSTSAGPSSSATSQASSSNIIAASTSPASTSKGSSPSNTESSPSSTESSPSSTDSSPSSTEDSQSSVTQSVVFRTTLANGAVSTVTSVTVVPAAQQGEQSGPTGTKTNTANASLQTNGGNQNSLGMQVVVGALGLVAAVAL